jgi:hypothetical protein
MVDVDATLTMPFVFCPATSHVLADVRAKKTRPGERSGKTPLAERESLTDVDQ